MCNAGGKHIIGERELVVRLARFFYNICIYMYSGVGTHAAAGAPAPAEIQDFILISTPEPLSCMLVHPLKKTSSYATDVYICVCMPPALHIP